MDGNIIIKNIGRLVTMEPASDREGPLGVISNAAVRITKMKIDWIGPTAKIPDHPKGEYEYIDAFGKVVAPGLIDCHTHLVHAGSRELEFAQRMRGATYTDIAKAGGGILSTVAATRKASLDELYEESVRRADMMYQSGVTTVEIKTGYGLDLETELKMLEVIEAIKTNHPLRVIATFLGAHTIPPEFQDRRQEYVELVIKKMIPAFAKKQIVRFIDIFVEKIAFTKEEARLILEAGKQHGLQPRLHIDQLSDSDGGKFAAEVGAVSADHLEYLNPSGIAAMKKSGVVAVLLPGATFFIGGKYTPARRLLDAGVAVALSTDYNPGTNPNTNLFLTGTMAATQMQMNLDEVWHALTSVPAKVLGVESECGSIALGKWGDLILLNTKHEYFPFYRYGQQWVERVIKKGRG